jgi:hypothetical protein
LGVSVAFSPTVDLNHCLSSSNKEIKEMDVQIAEANCVIESYSASANESIITFEALLIDLFHLR